MPKTHQNKNQGTTNTVPDTPSTTDVINQVKWGEWLTTSVSGNALIIGCASLVMFAILPGTY